MDLILWRHAEAYEHPDPVLGRQGDTLDLARRLTPRGEKQAARMPAAARVLTSPAQRTEQTALALGRKYKLRAELAPGADPLTLLDMVQWPNNKTPVVVVGHQPTLGQVIARLLGLAEEDCPVRKGAIWWLRQRERGGELQTVLYTVQTPELL
jgi:phosphohistidine phosphatase